MADEEAINDLSRGRPRGEREDRADFLRREREDKATKLAVDAALRAAEIDRRLDAHDARFALINGSMERTATNLAQLHQTVDKVTTALEALAESQRTRDAVSDALRQAVEKANEHQITTRQFAIGVAGLIVALLMVVVSTGKVL